MDARLEEVLPESTKHFMANDEKMQAAYKNALQQKGMPVPEDPDFHIDIYIRAVQHPGVFCKYFGFKTSFSETFEVPKQP